MGRAPVLRPRTEVKTPRISLIEAARMNEDEEKASSENSSADQKIKLDKGSEAETGNSKKKPSLWARIKKALFGS